MTVTVLRMIANLGGCGDVISSIRDVISLSKLLPKGDGPEEIEGLAKTFAKYTDAKYTTKYTEMEPRNQNTVMEVIYYHRNMW